MLKPEQREAIYRLALQQQYAELSDYLDTLTAPEGWKLVPVEPLQKLVEYADIADDTQYGTVASNLVRDLVSEALAAPTPPVVLPPPPQSFLILSRLQSGTEEVVRLDEAIAYTRAVLAQYGIKEKDNDL